MQCNIRLFTKIDLDMALNIMSIDEVTAMKHS